MGQKITILFCQIMNSFVTKQVYIVALCHNDIGNLKYELILYKSLQLLCRIGFDDFPIQKNTSKVFPFSDIRNSARLEKSLGRSQSSARPLNHSPQPGKLLREPELPDFGGRIRGPESGIGRKPELYQDRRTSDPSTEVMKTE